ncbi:rho guanine nucleotide exchange factor 17-like [Uloborus diversus]|uniref:rho guanine nucleotide exchange factor 17-like n=1 Tax=Uloborus diversus TaxID=327109 RepID=UPI002408F842|nr:rho guanine nucleotide exchange factor 17-like [Uloborus diversus]
MVHAGILGPAALFKYMVPLKEGEHREKIGAETVDSIFQGVPDMLRFHEQFLDTLRERLRQWDTRQKIGDVFVEAFTHPTVLDTYIEFINNWKSARDAIKSASTAKPAFAQFLEHTSREHKGKLSLDALLIMPVQRIPRYELLIKELLKHTPLDHPDYKLLLQAQREVHDLAVRINKVEREALHHEQRLQKLREVEQLVEGINDLTQGDRCFIRHDFVFIPGGLGLTKKERCLLLFSDLLLVASVKKKGGGGGAGGGVIARKTSPAISILSPTGSLESNKYKLLIRLSLDNVDIIKTGIDEPCVRKFLKEISSLENDIATVSKMGDLVSTLSCPHQNIEDAVKDLQTTLSKQLSEKQASSSQLMSLELAFNVNDEVENLLVTFPNPEQRMTWEAAFLETKEKLNKCSEKSCPPEFLCSLPIRKTRAGLQITCAAAVCEDPKGSGLPDLWVCSSDGYVGQVCILTFRDEPAIVSSASVANARILCIASVPGLSEGSLMLRRRSTVVPCLPGFQLRRLSKGQESKTSRKLLDSDSDDEDYIDAAEDELPSDDAGPQHPTMWLGTEDGCIYVYNSTHIQLKKAKLKIQHSTCIYDIVHVDGKVFVSLANGEIVVYSRELNGCWDSGSPHRVQIANDASPISHMVLIEGRLWCATLNSIVIINPTSIQIEHTFQAASEVRRHVTGISYASGLGVWVSIQASPSVHLYHVTSYDLLLELDVTPPVTRMLSSCDDIIRQHKLACLRVSSISVDSKGLLWIGTSAGVVLRFSRSPLNNSSRPDASLLSDIDSMPQGHFGHVRFICGINAQDFTPTSYQEKGAPPPTPKDDPSSAQTFVTSLMISGGDGYEEFGAFQPISDAPTGREDSTNHLLMWKT